MDNKLKAVIYMLCSALAFTFMTASVKMAGDIPVFEKVFFRNLVSLGVAFIVLKKSGASIVGKKENRKFLVLRSLCGLAGVALNFYAIGHLTIADSSMLNKLSPFFVTIFACIFLKEKLTKVQIPALIGAFIASLLIIKPDFSMAMLPGFSGLMGGMCAGLAYTIVRYLNKTEEAATIIFYFSLISVVGSIPFMLSDFVVPDMNQLFFLLGTGFFGLLGQFSVTLAYKYAPASEVSIYNYATIIFAIITGFVSLGEIPDSLSIAGGFLIIAVAAMVFYYKPKKSVPQNI